MYWLHHFIASFVLLVKQKYSYAIPWTPNEQKGQFVPQKTASSIFRSNILSTVSYCQCTQRISKYFFMYLFSQQTQGVGIFFPSFYGHSGQVSHNETEI